MDGAALLVPVGVNIPFGHAAVGMGPDDFVLAVDGVSGDLRPTLERAITNALVVMGDVIKAAIGELNPTHAGGVFLEFNGSF